MSERLTDAQIDEMLITFSSDTFAPMIRSLLEEVRTQRHVVDCLKTAAMLAVLNFERINHAGGDLFDDDHEAWTALNAALRAEKEGKNR